MIIIIMMMEGVRMRGGARARARHFISILYLRYALIDYYVGRAHHLYDPGILPCTGYGVPLRLATMSGNGQTDGQTDRRTDGAS